MVKGLITAITEQIIHENIKYSYCKSIKITVSLTIFCKWQFKHNGIAIFL